MTRPNRIASDTIAEYSTSIECDGVTVRTKCYRVTEGDKARLEIVLDAAGEKALVDLPADREARLPTVLREAANGFAASIAVRLDAGRL